jgi:hypothetical protein
MIKAASLYLYGFQVSNKKIKIGQPKEQYICPIHRKAGSVLGVHAQLPPHSEISPHKLA